MSDNWIIVIPEKSDYVPDEGAQDRAVALFRRIAPRAVEVKKKVSEEVRFIDCGGNLSRINCPNCGAELEIDWWQDLMDAEAEVGFPLREVSLPCCGAPGGGSSPTRTWNAGSTRRWLRSMRTLCPRLITMRAISPNGL